MKASKNAPLLAVLATLSFLGIARADEPSGDALLASKAPAIVYVKYVLKIPGGSREVKRQVAAAVVDSSGLVMCSATLLTGGARGGTRAKPVPADMKIVFGADPKEYASVLVAQDTNVDLAWIQILDLEGRVVAPIDLSAGAAIEVGQSLAGVMRKQSGFDYAAVEGFAYVTSRVEKPRPLWGISGDAPQPGLPLFDLSGKTAGVVTFQLGAEGADEGMRRASGRFLLPLDAVMKSLEEAKKHVSEAVSKAKAAAKEAEPAAPPAMDGEPKPPDAPDLPKPPDKPGDGK